MQDAETKALWRAAIVLLIVSAVRWGWVQRRPHAAAMPESVLVELSVAADSAAAANSRRSKPLGSDERIDPNRASAEELDRLPGIGPSTAAAIVAARDTGYVVRAPEDLVAVRGIGPALVDRVRDHLDLTAPPRPARQRAPRARPAGSGVRVGAPVDINTASREQLEDLPGVGPAIAARIVEHRQTRRFRSVEDLLSVSGIGPSTLERLRSRARVAGRR